MKNLNATLTLIVLCLLMIACAEIENKEFKKGKYAVFKAEPVKNLPEQLIYTDTSYIPIYSDIYTQTTNLQIDLTATLSLRNTSFKHSIFITHVDYYNSAGDLDKNFVKKAIELKPMQTMEYVIAEDHVSGGTGANFIVIWSAKSKNVNPLFESIMISTQNRQGISFTSRGVSIKN